MRIVAAQHDPPVWTLPAAQVRRIAQALPDDTVIDARSPEERLAAFAEADVIISARMSADEVAAAKNLKWVQSTAVGVEWLKALMESGRDVLITNVRGVHSDTIAEHAIALVLALRRRLHVAAARQATRTWSQTELQEVRNPPLFESRPRPGYFDLVIRNEFTRPPHCLPQPSPSLASAEAKARKPR